MPRKSAYKGPVNVVAQCHVDETARNIQSYPFAELNNPGDAFTVGFAKTSCKYERHYWQLKLSAAAAYWKKQHDCAYSVKSIPDVGLLVIRAEDNHPERRMECQL